MAKEWRTGAAFLLAVRPLSALMLQLCFMRVAYRFQFVFAIVECTTGHTVEQQNIQG